jgi:hypothetical protein
MIVRKKMESEETSPTPGATPRKPQWAKRALWGLGVVVVALIVSFVLVRPLFKHRGPLAQLNLADGRILQIEGVTFGTNHHIGTRSIFIDRFGPWLPQKLRGWLAPKVPENTFNSERPALVVWVNALNPETGTNVDCQGIRMEFVDQHGDLFGPETSSWYGGQTFWRVGHVFYSYPRSEAQLTLRVTPWKKDKNTPVTTQFQNPRIVPAANWSGGPLPQTKTPGPIEITLSELKVRTNDTKYWQTPSVYFEPVWQLRQGGQAAQGWSDPEWTAEDPTGNRGQQLGRHQPALRFSVSVYPWATNVNSLAMVAALPRVDLNVLTNQMLWNSKLSIGTNEFVALGVCPAGAYTFTGGDFDPTGPRMGAVRGGARSGWTGQTKRLTPMKLQAWHSHYTPTPTIYVRANRLKEPDRMALRVRDDYGRTWAAKPEPQGHPDGVYAFLLELPSEVTNIVPELVLLRPVEAEFLVNTGSTATP